MTAEQTTTGFTIERSFDATVDELWGAWTDPDELQHWWHPRGVHTPRDTIEVDLRVGGSYRYTMINDSTGEQYPTGGVYLEVEAPSRLVFTWGHPDVEPNDSPLITVALAADGDRCRMTFSITRLDWMDAEIRDGWDQAIDILAVHLGKQ